MPVDLDKQKKSAEVLQDENNHNKAEAEEDHDGSEDDDDDEGTRTYWRVKAKEGHKVFWLVSFKFVFVANSSV